ncbi:MAG: poly(R)-hydroxyalkanoic acid synthase subunit PhaE [Dehalococcoidia bacterium]
MADSNANPDPFAMWRDWLSQSERQWNSFLNEAMSTDEFSQAMARMMDISLNMQKNMNDVMGRYFTALNVPTRTDVLSLGNRLTEIEERLGAIESSVGALVPASARHEAAGAPAAVPKPPRTKQPKSA